MADSSEKRCGDLAIAPMKMIRTLEGGQVLDARWMQVQQTIFPHGAG